MLEARGVSRRYGWRWALKNVSLAVSPGETLALLGANGSGKTTLVKTLGGLLRPTEGEVHLGGVPLSREAKGRIGLLAHEAMLYAGLTLRENLAYFARLFGAAPERVNLVAEALGVVNRLDEPVRVLSQGLRQRAALARALLHEPDVVLLDEPFSGLDPGAAARLESVVRGLCTGGERIVIFTTHDVSRAFDMAERVVVLSGGGIAHEGGADDASRSAVQAALAPSAGEGG